MKVFLISCVTAIVLAIGGGVVLNSIQEPSSAAFSSPTGVRLG
jgi:hypothetical protein